MQYFKDISVFMFAGWEVPTRKTVPEVLKVVMTDAIVIGNQVIPEFRILPKDQYNKSLIWYSVVSHTVG